MAICRLRRHLGVIIAPRGCHLPPACNPACKGSAAARGVTNLTASKFFPTVPIARRQLSKVLDVAVTSPLRRRSQGRRLRSMLRCARLCRLHVRDVRGLCTLSNVYAGYVWTNIALRTASTRWRVKHPVDNASRVECGSRRSSRTVLASAHARTVNILKRASCEGNAAGRTTSSVLCMYVCRLARKRISRAGAGNWVWQGLSAWEEKT